MLDKIRLSDLPPYGKVFVGIFTTLMLLVCVWAGLIYYVSKGVVDKDHLPAYLTQNQTPAMTHEDSAKVEKADFDRQVDAGLYAEDSEAVLAPDWEDTTIAGRPIHADSVSNLQHFRHTDSAIAADTADSARGYDVDWYGEKPNLRHNVGLAHTHVNGQTLLFFAIGLVFLFTSTPAKTKKTVYWVFGIAIVLHTLGLTGQGFVGICDDILAISGAALVVVIAYMALRIYADLAKKPRE